MYFILPRLVRWEWPHAWAITLHFWLVFIGFGIYFWFLSFGGWLQGMAMLDASIPFMETMELTPALPDGSFGRRLPDDTRPHRLRQSLLPGARAAWGPERKEAAQMTLARYVAKGR